MLTGTTSDGFEYTLDEDTLNDMEIVDLAVEIQKNPENLSAAMDFYERIIGTEQKQRLYDHLRTETGKVPVKQYFAACTEMIKELKGNGKN